MSLQQLAIEALQRQANLVDSIPRRSVAELLFGQDLANDPRLMVLRYTQAAQIAPVYAIAPEMTETVKHAAATMPQDERVMLDDLLCREGILYLGDGAVEVRGESDNDNKSPVLIDTILWQVAPDNVNFGIAGFVDRDRNWSWVSEAGRPRHEVPRAIPIAHCVQGLGELVRDWQNVSDDPSDVQRSVAIWLATMRIMQQTTYSETVSQRAPRGIAKRQERAGRSAGVQIVQFRRRRVAAKSESTGRHLETRHIRSGHWRRHQRYKNAAGEWAEKSVYIAEMVVGPDDAPFVARPKVSVLQR